MLFELEAYSLPEGIKKWRLLVIFLEELLKSLSFVCCGSLNYQFDAHTHNLNSLDRADEALDMTAFSCLGKQLE